jgi:hypothetical protein
MTTTVAGGLRDRDFVLFWMGETVSKGGSALTTVALPLVAVQVLGANAFMMGLLGASLWLPWLVVGLPAGAWADRLRSRPLMIVCDLVAAVMFLSVPAATWLGILTIGQVLVVSLVTGCASVFFTAGYNAFVPFLVGREHIFDANVRLQGTEQAAQIVGPGIGGVIAQVSGAVLGLVVDSMTFLVSALCLRSIRAREPAERRSGLRKAGIRKEIGQALAFVVRDPYLRVLAGNAAAVNFCLSGVQALMVVFLVREVGLGGWSFGAVIMSTSVGGVIGAALAPRWSRLLGPARALLVISPLSALFGLLFALADRGVGLVLCLLGALLWSAGAVTNNVISGSFRQAYCPQEMLGRVATSIRFVIFGVMPIGSLAGGLLGTVFEVRTAIWILLIANLFARLILFTGPLKHSKDFPSVRPQ